MCWDELLVRKGNGGGAFIYIRWCGLKGAIGAADIPGLPARAQQFDVAELNLSHGEAWWA